MEKMKQIQNKDDFLKWARDVNFSTESKRSGICDLQDVFARSGNGNMYELKKLFLDSTEMEKQLLTFSIIKAMGEETAYRFIKSWARKQANICIEENMQEIQAGYEKLDLEKNTFNKGKWEIENKLNQQEKEIKELKELLENSRINNDGLHNTISRLEERNETLNNDLKTAYTALNETTKFKKYLKSIIRSEEL